MRKFDQAMQSPSSFDTINNYVGNMPDPSLLCLMAITRDSDILQESNWACALELLGGESDSVQIIRIGHWACGWIDYLCIVEGSDKEAIAEKIEEDINCYPILDEGDYSERETNAADQLWSCFSIKERIRYMREYKDQFCYHSFADIKAQVRGEYFGGSASELIY